MCLRVEIPEEPRSVDVPVEWTDLHPGPEIRPTAATPLLSIPGLLECAAQVEYLQSRRPPHERRTEEV